MKLFLIRAVADLILVNPLIRVVDDDHEGEVLLDEMSGSLTGSS
jgi:hypothetical protein